MPIVTFDYDHHKDAWSWVVIAKDKNIFGTSWKQNNSHVPTELLTQIQKVDFSEAIRITEDYLNTNPAVKQIHFLADTVFKKSALLQLTGSMPFNHYSSVH